MRRLRCRALPPARAAVPAPAADLQPCLPPPPLQLRHPNVISFAGVTFHGSKGVVLMELCEGEFRAL